jgi:hypothetical protein
MRALARSSLRLLGKKHSIGAEAAQLCLCTKTVPFVLARAGVALRRSLQVRALDAGAGLGQRAANDKIVGNDTF